ncbi:CBS domain-containing protein [Marinobacterium zhoushanense]|uniref:CBS domain-containing protein n=1 Tax=Marinobacterium zhoushanense TaxID=1679163 RepID=A0ABQ1KHC8_9GAMM|nr:CBS domain-containing protein [Marinobacterium zhoushanense]GGB99343.1 CBS domain-containing protein [Marinobacterium zhoushanense]
MAIPKSLVAADIMSRDLLTAKAHWSLQTLIEFFIKHKITGAPVLSDKQELIGVVSLSDLLKFDAITAHTPSENPMAQYYYSSLDGASIDELGIKESNPHLSHLVSEIMTPAIISTPSSTPVTELAAILCDKAIHRIFITDGKRLCGVVSTLDILKHLSELTQPECELC